MSDLNELALRRINDLEARLAELERRENNYLSSLELGAYSQRAVFSKAVNDNSATSVFRLSTTNESGSNDGGAYSVFVHALISHAGTPTTTDAAAKSFTAQFCRIMVAGGTGVSSAITEDIETASAASNALSRDIGTVTMTVTETSEYDIDVQFTVDGTGGAVSTLQVTCVVEIVWTGFTTPPVMSQL